MLNFYGATRFDLGRFLSLGKRSISEEEIKNLDSYKRATPEERSSFDGEILGSMSMGMSIKPKIKTLKSPYASMGATFNEVAPKEEVQMAEPLKPQMILPIFEEELNPMVYYDRSNDNEIDRFIA